MWAWNKQDFDKDDGKPKTLADQLIEEAEREDRLAEQYRGCSFVGPWPGSAHQERAGLLREAAIALMARKKR